MELSPKQNTKKNNDRNKQHLNSSEILSLLPIPCFDLH